MRGTIKHRSCKSPLGGVSKRGGIKKRSGKKKKNVDGQHEIRSNRRKGGGSC